MLQLTGLKHYIMDKKNMKPLSKVINAIFITQDQSSNMVNMIPFNPRSKVDIRRKINRLVNINDHMYISANGELYELSDKNKDFCANVCINCMVCKLEGDVTFHNCDIISSILRKFDNCLFKNIDVKERQLVKDLLDRDLSLCYLGIRTKHWTFLKKYKKEMVSTRLIRTGKKKRIIHIAKPQLLSAHKKISNKILSEYEPPNCVHGFVKGRGIASNADLHINKEVVIHFDIKDFFPSIHTGIVNDSLMAILPEEVVNIIMPLVMWKSSLPIGFSTSPVLSNVIFEPIDHRLRAIADTLKLVYSRYADNMVFSGSVDWTTAGGLVNHVAKAIYPFILNKKKTKIMRRGKRQYVTGIVVNDKRNVPVEYYKKLRACVHHWNEHDIATKRQVIGMLSYLNQINPYKYIKLKTQLCETICRNRFYCKHKFSERCMSLTHKTQINTGMEA